MKKFHFKSDRQRKWCFASGVCKGKKWDKSAAIKRAEREFETLQKRIEGGDEEPDRDKLIFATSYKAHRESIDKALDDYAEMYCKGQSNFKQCKEEFFRDYEDKVTEMQEEIIDTSKIFTNTDPESALQILKDGRIKNQFETGKSHGALSNETRVEHEYYALGVPKDTPPQYRPVYGWWALDREQAREVNKAVADGYGEITLQMKPTVKWRSTFTDGDSLGAVPGYHMVWGVGNMGKYNVPETTAHDLMAYLEGTTLSFFPPSAKAFHSGSYTEAQIHGGVSLKEVERVYIPKATLPSKKSLYNKIEKLAKSKGIEVVKIESPEKIDPDFDYIYDSDYYDE